MTEISKNYYFSILKRQRKLLLFYTLLLFVAFPLVMIVGTRSVEWRELIGTCLIFYMVLMYIAAMVVPLFTYRFNLNKRSVDTYYALPISRKGMYDVHFFAGLTCIYAPAILNMIIGLLLGALRSGLQGVAVYHIVGILVGMIITGAVYAINTVIVNKSNTLVDAAILTAAYFLLPFLMYLVLQRFFAVQEVGFTVGLVDFDFVLALTSPLYLLVNLTERFGYACRSGIMEMNWFHTLYALFILIAGYRWGASIYQKRRGEDSEQITRDFFTYPLIVNVSSVILLTTASVYDYDLVTIIMFIVITLILYLIMHFVSRRSMKITPSLVIKYLVILIAFNALEIIGLKTAFFGINAYTPDLSAYDRVEINADLYGENVYYYAVITPSLADADEQKLLASLSTLQKRVSEDKKLERTYDEDPMYVSVCVVNVDYEKGISKDPNIYSEAVNTRNCYSFRLPESELAFMLDNPAIEKRSYEYADTHANDAHEIVINGEITTDSVE